MKRKPLHQPILTYASSTEDFALRFEPQLTEVTAIIRDCDEEMSGAILNELCAQRLVISLPSICYGIPFPFVPFNVRVIGDKLSTDWHVPNPRSFIHAAQAIYVGLRLDSMDEIEKGQLHVCVRDMVEEPLIALCSTSAIDCIEVLKRYWNPRDSIDEFLRRIESMHRIVTGLTHPIIT